MTIAASIDFKLEAFRLETGDYPAVVLMSEQAKAALGMEWVATPSGRAIRLVPTDYAAPGDVYMLSAADAERLARDLGLVQSIG